MKKYTPHRLTLAFFIGMSTGMVAHTNNPMFTSHPFSLNTVVVINTFSLVFSTFVFYLTAQRLQK